MATCKCGCGSETRNGSTYLPGHDVRMREAAKKAWRGSRDETALRTLREHGWLDNVKDLRTFGVEMEILVPAEGHRFPACCDTHTPEYREAQREAAAKLVEAFRQAGLDARWEGYTHADVDYWKVVTDASVYSTREGNLIGLELVSPILSSKAGREQVRKACEVLAKIGVKINRNCGLHIHHGASDLSLDVMKRLAHAYGHYQGQIDNHVALSRIGNTYCKPIGSSYLACLDYANTVNEVEYRLDRYYALNLAAFARHGTVEFRQHQGTIEASKILAWLDMGQAMIRAARRGDSLVANLEDYTEMGSTRMAWWQTRMQELRRAA